MQSLKATIDVPIPEGYTIVLTSELKELKETADYDRWWTPKDLKDRYNYDMAWFREHVLYVPRFKDRLKYFVKYPKSSGKNGWQFEPKQFSQFMRENFKEICEEYQK